MESPLLNKSEDNVEVPINADTSSNDDHSVEVTVDVDSSSNEEHNVDTTVHDVSPSKAEQIYEAIRVVSFRWWEFVVTLVLTSAAILILALTKDEQQPKGSLYPWIISYIYASISTLLFLCWRFRQYTSGARISEEAEVLKIVSDSIFVCWFVALVWHLIDTPSSLDDTTLHFWICLTFFAFTFIMHVVPNYLGALGFFAISLIIRYFIPVFIHLCHLGYQLGERIEVFVNKYIWPILSAFVFIIAICGCICGSGCD